MRSTVRSRSSLCSIKSNQRVSTMYSEGGCVGDESNKNLKGAFNQSDLYRETQKKVKHHTSK